MGRFLQMNHRKHLRSLFTCLLLAGTCTFLVLLMINLFSDNGKTAVKLDRMAVINKPIQAKGIQNTGAICFASSVAQMLFRIDGIRQFILNLDENLNLPPHESQSILGLKNLFKSLHDPEIKVVKEHAGKFIPSQFTRGEQGDADEFYSAWMELLEKLMRSELHSELFLQVALNRTRTDTTGTTSNSTISSDLWSSVKVTFPDNLRTDPHSIPLETMLTHENGPFGQEIINPQLRQQFKITAVPRYVALSFVRTEFVQGGPRKINTPVLIPEFLNLSPVSSETIKPLRLKMFTLHRGSVNSGHYVAYVRDTEEVWHLIDDDKIKQVSKIEALEASKISSICIYKQE